MNKIINNLNDKNRKTDFSFVLKHCVSFWTKKLKRLFLRGGVCMSLMWTEHWDNKRIWLLLRGEGFPGTSFNFFLWGGASFIFSKINLFSIFKKTWNTYICWQNGGLYWNKRDNTYNLRVHKGFLRPKEALCSEIYERYRNSPSWVRHVTTTVC